MELRGYQSRIAREAVELLTKHRIAYLAMQTRTGKTITSLYAADLYGSKSVLFVTKKKAIDSIKKDYDTLSPSYAIDVINYESLHKVSGRYDLVIADEAHSIGQFPKPNNRCKALKVIAKGLPILLLSATPSPESYSQLYHQLWVSDYSPFGSYRNFYGFAKDFVTVQTKYLYNREIKDYSNCDKQKLWGYIKHLFITYTQQEAGFSVTVNEKILSVPMPAYLIDMIKTLNKHNVYKDESVSIIADTAVKVMQKTHQLSSGTVIDEHGYKVISTFKADYLSDYFANKKLAIFYKFKSEYEMLKSAFPNSTDNAFEFQNNNNITFLGQFQSAREGIRLDTADAIVFFNIDFSFLSYEQARNRIASFERKDAAILYWLFSDRGIERRIYEAVKNKEDYTLSHYRYDRKQI